MSGSRSVRVLRSSVSSGAASYGRGAILDHAADSAHQRIAVILGSKHEVERIERYHNAPQSQELPEPLFCERSLFRSLA